ncbi:unnamed protein product [Cylindrotheca closterium]|uniref:Uncharacterized protein n=1 Tax=Cylindrotheca closterium TaxID=2856 RepID=A0AAD2FGT3_9STRA|nr:unnamed protein product [Cylindrotheca closterium]
MTKDMRPRPAPAADSRIRDNLIFKLGVVKSDQKPAVRSEKSVLGKQEFASEPLKSRLDEEDIIESPGWNLSALFSKSPSRTPSVTDLASLSSSHTTSDSVSETSSAANKRLTFNETVTVCSIPNHDAYSKRIKEQLWNTPEEIMANATRNSIEFAAEGWDWRNTLEDENMYRCVGSNEKIHPVHVENYEQQHQQQQEQKEEQQQEREN